LLGADRKSWNTSSSYLAALLPLDSDAVADVVTADGDLCSAMTGCGQASSAFWDSSTEDPIERRCFPEMMPVAEVKNTRAKEQLPNLGATKRSCGLLSRLCVVLLVSLGFLPPLVLAFLFTRPTFASLPLMSRLSPPATSRTSLCTIRTIRTIHARTLHTHGQVGKSENGWDRSRSKVTTIHAKTRKQQIRGMCTLRAFSALSPERWIVSDRLFRILASDVVVRTPELSDNRAFSHVISNNLARRQVLIGGRDRACPSCSACACECVMSHVALILTTSLILHVTH